MSTDTLCHSYAVMLAEHVAELQTLVEQICKESLAR